MPVKIDEIALRPMPCRRNDSCSCVGPCKMKPFHNVIEPMFESEEYVEYMETIPILKRISVGFFSWAGDGLPNDAHFWGKQDFLNDPQFQGDSEINFFRKTNTDLVTFLQTEGWLCLVRIRRILRMLNTMDSYDDTIESLSRNAGFPVDSWGSVFEKMHPQQCRCAPCSALREVKKQLEKKNIAGQEVTLSVIHHIRRCVYRVLISGIDRIFETFCSRRFSVVWFILAEEFDEHYRDAEFEKLCSLIMNDIAAIEPITSLANFSKTFLELYEGATDLARAVLHKFAVIMGSQKMFYTTSMNFIMFYIDSFNMIIRMLRWLENKFRVFNQLANGISKQTYEDKLDFKSLILHAMNELVYKQPDVISRRETALEVICAYQKMQNSYFGPHIDNLERYLEYIDSTLFAASAIFEVAKPPCKCPTFKVPTRNVIDAALYINPYRDDQFDAPQVFHCYWQDRFIIERSQTPWKILYNNKAKILLRLTVENPADKNKKLAINVFLAEDNPSVEDRIKDQYFALYESRLERLVDFFDVLKQEVIEYYANTNSTMGFFEKLNKYTRKSARCGNKLSLSKVALSRRMQSNNKVTKISVPVKIKRPDKRSRYSKDSRMAILSSLMQKHRKSKKPSTTENLEQLLTFAVKIGIEGSGMLPELAGNTKDVYVSITSVDKARRAKADQEFSLHELMSFIIFWYARHGCVTEFEGHTLHRTTFGCTKSSFKESFPLLYKAAEELDAAVGEGLLSDNDLAILEKGLSNSMTEEEMKRCKNGLETTLHMKTEFNELVQSKRAFAKLASTGFCVTLSGPLDEPTAVLTTEPEPKKSDQSNRKKQMMTKVPEIRNRMRKTLEGRHTDVVVTPKAAVSMVHQGKLVVEEVKTIIKTPQTSVQLSKEIDVDELVQLIEGTNIRSDQNPKKAAKKARQKEKKEQERQRIAEEKAREEAERKAEMLRQQEAERKRIELERKRIEAEEKRLKEEIQKKEREAAEVRREEQRKKREEVERRKALEKRLKKEAKKMRREQRKREQDLGDTKQQSDDKPLESMPKPAPVIIAKPETVKKTDSVELAPEKEYGRLKHEKEQRKREEEEARRLQQLKAQERVQASKKSKKKKKKQRNSGDSENVGDLGREKGDETKTAPVGQPLIKILNTSSNENDEQAKNGEEKSNLVTIKKHMDSSVTISMKGKEGEEDLVYTLVNGQVFPTTFEGRLPNEDVLPMQQTAFIKSETSKGSNIQSVSNASSGNGDFMTNMNSMKNNCSQQQNSKLNNLASSGFGKDCQNLAEIDLTQLKLPPGITITKVPQNVNDSKLEEIPNGNLNSVDIHVKPPQPQPAVPEYQRSSSSVSGFNSNVMVVDSRCSSLESPVIGVRTSDMMYGANGTRPSSETSITSDRPSSGLDSIYNNGPSPFLPRVGYPSSEAFGKRVPISMSSPFATTSRNETPSPAWQTEMNPNLIGVAGTLPMSTSITPDRHGFWSSSPASPVTFAPANSVTESYIRAQDQQFIKPRPHVRPNYPTLGKASPSPSLFNQENSVCFSRNAPVPEFQAIARGVASRTPSFEQSTLGINDFAPTPQPVIAPIGFKPLVKAPVTQCRPMEQWTPWSSANGDRFSPDISNASTLTHTSPFSLTDLICGDDDVNAPWDSAPLEKINFNGTNPYGAIGQKRSSNATAANGHSKISEAPSSVIKSPFYVSNGTF